MAEAGYAGDLSPTQAWALLESEKAAMLVDVRTEAEWRFVGLPDLTSLGKTPRLVSWQVFPSMGRNHSFVDEVKAAGISPGDPVVFLCRSGGRSRAAAIAVTAAGFARAYNLAGGFEGGLDGARHRGTAEGWKAEGLPWIQD